MKPPGPGVRLAAALAVFVLAAASPTQAALNGNRDFSLKVPFEAGFGSGGVTILSGAAQGTLSEETGPFGFLGLPDSVMLSGLNRVYTTRNGGTEYSGSSDLSLLVTAGDQAGFGLHLPKPTTATFASSQSLAIPYDLSSTQIQGFQLGPVLATRSQDAVLRLVAPADIPTAQLTLGDVQGGTNKAGALIGLTTTSTVQVLQGGKTLETIVGNTQGLLFQGKPTFTHAAVPGIAARVMVLPFTRSSISMQPASHDAAVAGLDLGGLLSDVHDLGAALGSTGEFQKPDMGPLQGVLGGLLNGAYLHATGGADAGAVLRNLTLVRFESADARATSKGLTLSGSEPFRLQGGRVVDAPGLVGFGYMQLPWWSWMLWVLAIGAFVARIVLKAPKQHEGWDRYKWVGRLAGVVAFLLVLWLWDLEVQHVLGVSILGGDATGDALLPVAGLELAPLMIVYFAAVTPIRLLLVSGLRIGKQGTFMNLSGAIAILVGYLIGATLLLAYIDLAVRSAGGA